MINKKEIDFLNNYTPEKAPTLDELKAQKLQLQIEEMKEKRQSKQIPQKSTLSKITTTLFYIILMPLLITGFFFIECARHSVRSGSRRR